MKTRKCYETHKRCNGSTCEYEARLVETKNRFADLPGCAPLGTAWTKPGEGASVLALRLEIQESTQFSHVYANGRSLAAPAWDCLVVKDPDHRTDLALTGHPLTAYDLKRIQAAK